MARQIGLRDIHIAILTKDDNIGETYDTPVKLERAISAKISPKSNSDNIYSDDTEGEKPKAQSAKLKGKFYPRKADGNYGFIADEDAVGVDASIISGGFNVVPSEPTETQS